MFHVPMMDFSACNLMPALCLTLVVHLSPPPCSIPLEGMVIVDDRALTNSAYCSFVVCSWHFCGQKDPLGGAHLLSKRCYLPTAGTWVSDNGRACSHSGAS